MRSGALVLIFFLVAPLFPSDAEDSLTSHILNRLLLHAAQRIPDRLPPRLIPGAGEGTEPLLRNDTLYLPADLRGYQASGDYRLPFYAGLLLFQTILFRDRPATAESFYRASVEAYGLALEYVHTVEQDPLLDDLIAYHYLLLPYRAAGRSVLVDRDFTVDSLKFRCMQRCILGFRCDSTKINEWINGDRTVSARLVACTQRPLGWGKGFELDITVRNDGEIPAPVGLLLRFSSGDTLLRLPAFATDTSITCRSQKSLLSAELDPSHRLLDLDEEDHKFVSSEYVRKHRARLMITSCAWDTVSLFSAFALLLLLGIFITPLTRLFYTRPGSWYTACVGLALFIKFFLPAVFYGFTLYGFVYDITFLLSNTSRLWIALSFAATARLMYYIFEKDGVEMNQLASAMKYLLFICAVEPLLLSVSLFF